MNVFNVEVWLPYVITTACITMPTNISPLELPNSLLLNSSYTKTYELTQFTLAWHKPTFKIENIGLKITLK
jgi:hypothetical protein